MDFAKQKSNYQNSRKNTVYIHFDRITFDKRHVGKTIAYIVVRFVFALFYALCIIMKVEKSV